MGKVIGKVIATEKNPSTIDDFYFWTKQDLILNPFDVVKVNHLQHSVSYGVIEEISHITDTANFFGRLCVERFWKCRCNRKYTSYWNELCKSKSYRKYGKYIYTSD